MTNKNLEKIEKGIVEEFDKQFPYQEIMEAVETDVGGDVVPVGTEFVKPVEPHQLKSFLLFSLRQYRKEIIMTVCQKAIVRNQKEILKEVEEVIDAKILNLINCCDNRRCYEGGCDNQKKKDALQDIKEAIRKLDE